MFRAQLHAMLGARRDFDVGIHAALADELSLGSRAIWGARIGVRPRISPATPFPSAAARHVVVIGESSPLQIVTS